MTLGGNERLNLIIGLEFQPGDSVSAALRTGQNIRKAVQDAFAQPLTFSDITNNTAALAAAERLGQQMREKIDAALKVNVQNAMSQGVGAGGRPMSSAARNFVTAAQGEVPTAGYAEQLRLAAARAKELAEHLRREDAEVNKAAIDTAEANAKEIRAALGVETASRALEKAKGDFARAVNRQEQLEIAAGRKEEEARARATVAIQRRADAETASGQREQAATGREILALQRRKDAEDKAAQEAADAAAETRRAQAYQFQPRFANPDLGSQLGQAQDRVNRALFRAEIAQDAHTALINQVNYTEDQYKRSLLRLEEATSALAAAERNQITAATKAGQPPAGGLIDQFRLGFKGETQKPYAEQIGQAFKFSIFYGTAYKLLFALTQTFQQTLQEGIAFEQSMTDLSLASGKSADSMSDIARNLGDTAVQAGQAPSVGLQVGARSLGLYGAAGSGVSKADQAYISEVSTRVATRLAVGSKQAPEDIATSLAAISNAFGTGAGGQIRTADLDAYLTKKFGVGQGATLVPVAEAGTVGAAAGFSQAQVTAIAAALEARTGQTDSAVAGFMAQIFTRGGEGSLANVSQQFGINTDQPLSQQIGQLAQTYKTASNDQKEVIAAAFGRGKVQNAAVALLQSFPEIAAASKKAETLSPGEADKQFNLRMSNIGGQLALLQGSLKQFASALGQSGLLDVIGAAVVALRYLVNAGTDLLHAFGDLNGIVRYAIEALAAFVIGTKIATGGNILTQAGRASAAGGIGALGSGKTGTFLANNYKGIGLSLAVLADFELWQGFKDSTRKLTDAQNTLSKTFDNTVGPGSTPDQMRAQADALTSAAAQGRASDNGFFGRLSASNPLGLNHATDVQVQAQAQQADAEAKRLRALAKTEEEFTATRSQSQVAITGFDSASLTSSMQAITDAGGTAQDQFNALTDTLNNTAGAASRAAGAFQPNIFAGENAGPLSQLIQNSVSQQHKQYNPLDPAELFSKAKVTNLGPQKIAAAISTQDIATRMSAALTDIGQPIGELSVKQMNQVAKSVLLDTAQKAFGDLKPSEVAKAQKFMQQAVVKFLKKQADLANAIAKGAKLSPTQATAYLNGIVQSGQAILDALPENDYQGRIKQAQAIVTAIRQGIRNTKGGATDDALQKLDVARHQVAEATINRLEALRRAAQHVAKSDADAKSIGRGFFTREMHAAIREGDSSALVGLINNAGNWSIDITRNAIKAAIAVARAGIATQQAAQRYAAAEMASIGPMMGRPAAALGGPSAKVARRLKELRDMLSSLSSALPAGSPNVYDNATDANRPDGSSAAAADAGPTAAQIAAARRTALAEGSESQIAIARAAMATARADMAAAKKGTVEYYSALGAYLQARNELTDAVQEYRKNLYLLSHDITNPLDQARAETRAAAAKLRSDAKKPADVRAADRLALRQAQAGQEAQAFQQRLETVQTAEQLGRMSYSAYINYLNHERDRLRGIAHRSYQQQQELNQIDGLLKDAADQMQGQWNFGDIHLPTPYQVRRYIEAHSGNNDGGGNGHGGVFNDGPKHPGGGDTHYVRINIDGADTGAVIRILKNVLGTNVVASSGGGRHR